MGVGALVLHQDFPFCGIGTVVLDVVLGLFGVLQRPSTPILYSIPPHVSTNFALFTLPSVPIDNLVPNNNLTIP